MTLPWTVLRKFAGHPPLDSVLDLLHSLDTAGGGTLALGDRIMMTSPERVHKEREMDRKTLCEISK